MWLMNYTTDDAKDTSSNEVEEVSTDDPILQKQFCTVHIDVFLAQI